MIRSETRAHIATVTIDNPPVNALPVAGWFELADALRAAGRDPDVRVVILQAEGKGFQAGVDIKELAADPTQREPRRGQPRLLRGVRRGLRLRGAGDRGRARLLPRRRRRARGQRRHRRRLRRRDLRPARGRPRRARRRDAPRPLRAAAQAARDVLHRLDDHRAGAARVRHRRARRARATSCYDDRARDRGDHRREEPDRDAPGQGVAQP